MGVGIGISMISWFLEEIYHPWFYKANDICCKAPTVYIAWGGKLLPIPSPIWNAHFTFPGWKRLQSLTSTSPSVKPCLASFLPTDFSVFCSIMFIFPGTPLYFLISQMHPFPTDVSSIRSGVGSGTFVSSLTSARSSSLSATPVWWWGFDEII